MKSKTYYHLLLDASGSMGSVRMQTLDALNEQLLSIRAATESLPGAEILVSLSLFNTEVNMVFSNLHPSQLPVLEPGQYRPGGCTALLDALGLRIREAERMMSPIDDAVFVVLTDGMENSSQYFSYRQLAHKIADLKRTEHWTFSFIGADMDAWAIARRLNVERDEVRNYSKENMGAAFSETTASVREYISSKESGKKKKGLFSKEDLQDN